MNGLDLTAHLRALRQGSTDAGDYKQQLAAGQNALEQAFSQGTSGRELVNGRTLLVDTALIAAWQAMLDHNNTSRCCLLATGGYGRAELLPHSDVDLVLLLPADHDQQFNNSLSAWLTWLWDTGLDLGSAVRTVQDCRENAESDLTIMTNLMEARYLCGDRRLHDELQGALAANKLWSAKAFFAAKNEEQAARRERYQHSAYRLEPNIKESPGGLRDIHTISWIVQRQFGNSALEELADGALLTREEVQTLREAREFLWRVRFALHTLTGRGENRLLFDHQRALAEALGYGSTEGNAGVERFMQDYYRTITEVVRLNEMLLQLFRESIVNAGQAADVRVIDHWFSLHDGYLQARDERLFEHHPAALLEVFILACKLPDFVGFRASTIRMIRQNLHRIDDNFRRNLQTRRLFIELLQQTEGVTHQLRRMNRYGVLAAYIPAFEQIVGRMQFDLFHIYTVDEHTLMVVRNLRRFAVWRLRQEMPHCSRVMDEIERPEVLYLAGLFHDIAKGRKGDHWVLGADDAREFCLQHGLNRADRRLTEWLVRHHLLMSTTIQRKDIYDPEVIYEFAREVGSLRYLNHLYLLTVADIRGTNPALWNDWKDQLLSELYRTTRDVIRLGLDSPPDREEIVADRQQEANQLLIAQELDPEHCQPLWGTLGDDYFLRYSGDEIAWQSHQLCPFGTPVEQAVLVRTLDSGCTEITVYTRDTPGLFSKLVAIISVTLNLDILDARIHTTNIGYALDVFHVLSGDGNAIADRRQLQSIRAALLNPQRATDAHKTPVPRQLRAFPRKPTVAIQEHVSDSLTSVMITATDSPGALAAIARSFADADIQVHGAKIATFGEKIEDIFFVSSNDGRAITDPTQLAALRESLIRNLS